MRTLIIYFVLISTEVFSQNFKHHICVLTSDSLYGRSPASIYEIRAANYITNEFNSGKLHTTSQAFNYNDETSLNILGSTTLQKDSTIIFLAHYDHLGEVSAKSLEILKKRGKFHPGADDNASGVALMLELASWISTKNNLNYNFVFAALSAHEEGLYGASYFSKSDYFKSLKTRAVINLDMVGRLDKVSHNLRVYGIFSDKKFETYFTLNQEKNFHFNLMSKEDIPLNDTKFFAESNIPYLSLTTGIHDDYHRYSDTEDKINYEGLALICNMIKELINEI